MAVSFSVVEGPGFAAEASRILEESWEPPALLYTPEYLRWQLSFPSALKLPAVSAFNGSEPVGFAGAGSRRLRCGSRILDAAVVSFVAVHPQWRGQGVASGLYRTLLNALADLQVPVVTYAIPGSAGDKALLRAYPEAGFRVHAIETCSNYAFALRQASAGTEWAAYFSGDPEKLLSVAARISSQDPSTLWSMPAPDQVAHYMADPRPRKLIFVERASQGVCGAGFVVHSELRTMQGIERVTLLDSVWMSGTDGGGLRELLRLAASAWPSSGGSVPVVMCPNLSGFGEPALKAAGVRRTGARFGGYFCVPGPESELAPQRTNLEIV